MIIYCRKNVPQQLFGFEIYPRQPMKLHKITLKGTGGQTNPVFLGLTKYKLSPGQESALGSLMS